MSRKGSKLPTPSGGGEEDVAKKGGKLAKIPDGAKKKRTLMKNNRQIETNKTEDEKKGVKLLHKLTTKSNADSGSSSSNESRNLKLNFKKLRFVKSASPNLMATGRPENHKTVRNSTSMPSIQKRLSIHDPPVASPSVVRHSSTRTTPTGLYMGLGTPKRKNAVYRVRSYSVESNNFPKVRRTVSLDTGARPLNSPSPSVGSKTPSGTSRSSRLPRRKTTCMTPEGFLKTPTPCPRFYESFAEAGFDKEIHPMSNILRSPKTSFGWTSFDNTVCSPVLSSGSER